MFFFYYYLFKCCSFRNNLISQIVNFETQAPNVAEKLRALKKGTNKRRPMYCVTCRAGTKYCFCIISQQFVVIHVSHLKYRNIVWQYFDMMRISEVSVSTGHERTALNVQLMCHQHQTKRFLKLTFMIFYVTYTHELFQTLFKAALNNFLVPVAV